MNKIVLKKQKIDYKNYIKQSANEKDCDKLISESSILYDQDSGQIFGLYCKPKGHEEFFRRLRKSCQETKYDKTERLSGLVTTSRIFGYRPRNGLRGNFCSMTSLARQQRKQYETFVEGGIIASSLYAEHNQKLYKKHEQESNQKVLPEFRLSQTPFTSGIVNDNNPLCYHFDVGNFHNVWSAMIVLKSGIENGHLSMPEYGVKCEVADQTVFFFDGQNVLHGVTPIIKKNPYARRFSIVYYSLREMWKCLPVNEELARIRNMRTMMESSSYVPAIRKNKGS